MTMKTIKVAEATERQLDWLVARIEGDELPKDGGKGLDYSTDWALGGPIIEREGIGFFCNRTAAIGARFTPDAGADWRAFALNKHVLHYYGSTPLMAAMRCYVASKLGDTVEVPEELV